MLFKKLLHKSAAAILIASSSYVVGIPAVAQSFFFPSASFFTPHAGIYQSEEDADLITFLEEYQTFSAKLGEAKLIDKIQQQGSLTVFVPSDRAFAALSPDIKQKLADPENLSKVLRYHFVIGKISESDIKRRAVATQLEGSSVSITGVPAGDKVNVKLNEALASEPLLTADDSVIIPIDRVLLPPGF